MQGHGTQQQFAGSVAPVHYFAENLSSFPKALILVVTALSSPQMLAFSAWFLVSRRPDINMIMRHLTFVDHNLNIVSIDI